MIALLPFMLLLALGTVGSAEADDLEALLKRPVSPGALGLLVSHAADPRVEARWREGLRDASPHVRAAAARLLLVNGVTGAIPDLARMVESDIDPAATLEAARALLLMSAGPADVLVLAAAKRLNDDRLSRAVVEAQSASKSSGGSAQPGYRTVFNLPDGYVADVLKMTGCDPPTAAVLAGVGVRYSEVRHLKEIQWIPVPLKSGCANAARAILTAGLLPAPAQLTPGDRNVIVLPMNRVFLRCLAGSHASIEPLAVSPVTGPPRKTKHVNPEYPTGASRGTQPMAILVIRISRTGCVEELRVTSSSGPAVDAESIRAISQWEFEPIVANGSPIPVTMPVTMSFTLR